MKGKFLNNKALLYPKQAIEANLMTRTGKPANRRPVKKEGTNIKKVTLLGRHWNGSESLSKIREFWCIILALFGGRVGNLAKMGPMLRKICALGTVPDYFWNGAWILLWRRGKRVTFRETFPGTKNDKKYRIWILQLTSVFYKYYVHNSLNACRCSKHCEAAF